MLNKILDQGRKHGSSSSACFTSLSATFSFLSSNPMKICLVFSSSENKVIDLA